MESKNIKILIADDHSVIRHGIMKSISDSFPGVEYCEASSATEIMNHVHNNKLDLVVLDISMPGRNGLEILKEVKVKYPEIPVIIFSMYPEDQFAVRSIRDGASAYLTKNISSKELVEAIRITLKGERYLTPPVVKLITKELLNNQDKPIHETLSDREYQVFLLIASGKNVSAIARELSLSVKTISVYRSIILKKMNLKNNAEITYYAFKNSLVD
jgi:two-component system invasion response regulator UvrY